MNILLRFSKKNPSNPEIKIVQSTYCPKEQPTYEIYISEEWVLDGLSVSEFSERLKIVSLGVEEQNESAFTRHKKDWEFFWSKKQIFVFKKPKEQIHLATLNLFKTANEEKVSEILIFFEDPKQ